jgi:hypothetical protein
MRSCPRKLATVIDTLIDAFRAGELEELLINRQDEEAA